MAIWRDELVADIHTELGAKPATAVFWFPKLRRQCRISGQVQILSEKDNDTRWLGAWRALSDSSRALFHWPPPGEVRITHTGDFPKLIPVESPAPENFEVLLLIPESAETLDLNPHPQLRVRWELAHGQWQRFPINP